MLFTVSIPFCAQLSSAKRRRISSSDVASDDVHHLAVALDRPAEDDEAVVDEPVHE